MFVEVNSKIVLKYASLTINSNINNLLFGDFTFCTAEWFVILLSYKSDNTSMIRVVSKCSKTVLNII